MPKEAIGLADGFLPLDDVDAALVDASSFEFLLAVQFAEERKSGMNWLRIGSGPRWPCAPRVASGPKRTLK